MVKIYQTYLKDILLTLKRSILIFNIFRTSLRRVTDIFKIFFRSENLCYINIQKIDRVFISFPSHFNILENSIFQELFLEQIQLYEI